MFLCKLSGFSKHTRELLLELFKMLSLQVSGSHSSTHVTAKSALYTHYVFVFGKSLAHETHPVYFFYVTFNTIAKLMYWYIATLN